MKKCFYLLIALAISTISFAQTPDQWEKIKGEINVFMANDLGRNGYYDQKPIAALMGKMAEVIEPECIIAAGDVHHFDGVQSVEDPLWMTNYELIYDHPELMISWLPILGNHEYRGNTQAVMDYSNISRRWCMPNRYYTRVFKEDNTSIRFVMIDTTPLMSKYRKDSDKYPDACKQDVDQQLQWLDSVLSVAKEEWVIVVGHHPIYAETPKSASERTDMQANVNTILQRHKNVAMYLCGHIHNFQHIRQKKNHIDYVVNSSASLSREVKPTPHTVFCSSESGFSVITADQGELCLHMVDKNGNILHTIRKITFIE
ncbi:MAG: metallophosphoesterase [Paludibacteraceae bacterium]|nr:metallophosphoesterase [Paludibacteraceae bacterium]